MPPQATVHIAAPVTLADYAQPGLVVPRRREREAAGIIGELSQALQRQG